MKLSIHLSFNLAFLALNAYIIFGQYEPWPKPPPWKQRAAYARFLVHHASWGTVSGINPSFGYAPFGVIQSFADGPEHNSTGIPYFFIAKISDMYEIIKYNNTVSLTVSLAESSICEKLDYDPMEPVCGRLTVVGEMHYVSSQNEIDFAKNALFSRHPAMKGWPVGHGWQVNKLIPKAFNLLDTYGGGYHVPIKDYFAANP